MPLDHRALKSSFDEDGFVVLPGFVSATEVEVLREHAKQAATHRQDDPSGEFQNVQKGLEKLDPYFEDLLHRGAHLPVLERLLGEKPTPATSSYFTKESVNEPVHPHADGTNGGTIWIALDPIDSSNGGLCFLRGSHEREGRTFFGRHVQATDFSGDPRAVSLELEPGDMVLFRATTVHWSGTNESGRPRRAINCFYIDTSRIREEWAEAKRQMAAEGTH